MVLESPACAVIYQTAKDLALFSPKGYAIGNKFRKWLEAEEEARAAQVSAADLKLLGFVEDFDLLDICGSRDLDYVFFMDAAPRSRSLESLGRRG